jgi:hypothetical protein
MRLSIVGLDDSLTCQDIGLEQFIDSKCIEYITMIGDIPAVSPGLQSTVPSPRDGNK